MINALSPPSASLTLNDKPDAPNQEDALRDKAVEFETTFIAAMLRNAGLDEAFAGDTGLTGEAFSSILIDTYADQLAKKGGFGLADQIYGQLRDDS